MAVSFKFCPTTPDDRRDKLRKELERQGAEKVRPLFPNDKDEELSTIYVADFPHDDVERRVTELLNQAPEVDYVEPVVRRKLIR